LHVPPPLQNDCGWYVEPLHETEAPQGVVGSCCWQLPFTHRPVLPHEPVFEHRPYGSTVGVDTPTFEQVPAPLRLQAWQVGQLPVVQQTPSVQ
jgi:hypothetical protein